MQLRRARVLKPERDLHGIFRVDRFAGEVAHIEAHALAAAYVDGRDEFHAASTIRRKLERSRNPIVPLFSGWNWVAQRLPRAIAAQNEVPYSVTPIVESVSSGSA